jgi:hypothetical protein
MAAAFAEKTAAMRLQVSKEVDTFHVSSGTEPLADDGDSGELLLREGAIGLQDQLDCFAKIRPGLVEGIALGVRARELLNEGDVAAFGGFTENGGQFEREGLLFHGLNLPKRSADV